jgi:hypothetical protein
MRKYLCATRYFNDNLDRRTFFYIESISRHTSLANVRFENQGPYVQVVALDGCLLVVASRQRQMI